MFVAPFLLLADAASASGNWVAVATILAGVAYAIIGYFMFKQKSANESAAADRAVAAQDRADAKVAVAAVALKAEKVAEKVAEVAQKQEVSTGATLGALESIQATTIKTHARLDGEKSVELRRYAVAVQRIADLEKNPTNEFAAKTAMRAYEDHMETEAALQRVQFPKPLRMIRESASPELDPLRQPTVEYLEMVLRNLRAEQRNAAQQLDKHPPIL